ncbi:MAG: MmoB/DmpM family protein [Acidimicrobiia bacterium]
MSPDTTKHREALVGIELLPGDEAEAVLAAAEETNDEVVVDRNAAVVMVQGRGRLHIELALVRAHLGRDDWSADDLQVIMASYFGFITQWDEDAVVLEWLGKDEGN